MSLWLAYDTYCVGLCCVFKLYLGTVVAHAHISYCTGYSLHCMGGSLYRTCRRFNLAAGTGPPAPGASDAHRFADYCMGL